MRRNRCRWRGKATQKLLAQQTPAPFPPPVPCRVAHFRFAMLCVERLCAAGAFVLRARGRARGVGVRSVRLGVGGREWRWGWLTLLSSRAALFLLLSCLVEMVASMAHRLCGRLSVCVLLSASLLPKSPGWLRLRRRSRLGAGARWGYVCMCALSFVRSYAYRTLRYRSDNLTVRMEEGRGVEGRSVRGRCSGDGGVTRGKGRGRKGGEGGGGGGAG